MPVPFPDLRDRDLRVAVVGATGAVGEVLLDVLAERRFPVGELRPLASGRSAGSKIEFRGEPVHVQRLAAGPLTSCDLVFCAAPEVLREHLPALRGF